MKMFLATIYVGEDFNNECAQAIFADDKGFAINVWKQEEVAKSIARYERNQGWQMNPNHYDMIVKAFDVIEG